MLALCAELPGATAILDDAEGRACARSLRIPVVGTLGLVLRAKKRGRIDSAAAVMRAVRAAGLYLDEALLREALGGAVGEAWE